MKPVRLSAHAREQARFRGTTEAEMASAVTDGVRAPALRGRIEARKTFAYDAEWNGKHYDLKQVRPVFVDEPNEIVVITVYTYYF